MLLAQVIPMVHPWRILEVFRLAYRAVRPNAPEEYDICECAVDYSY